MNVMYSESTFNFNQSESLGKVFLSLNIGERVLVSQVTLKHA